MSTGSGVALSLGWTRAALPRTVATQRARNLTRKFERSRARRHRLLSPTKDRVQAGLFRLAYTVRLLEKMLQITVLTGNAAGYHLKQGLYEPKTRT